MARNQTPLPVIYGAPDERRSVREILARLSLPWLPLPLLLLAGVLAHLAWGRSAALPLITAGLALGTVGLAAGTWSITSRHSHPAGAHATGTAAAAGIWFLLATTFGPLAQIPLTLFWLVGCGLALSWNVRMAIKPSRPHGEQEPKSPRAHGKALMAALGLKGTEMVPTEATATRIAGELTVDGSHTIDDIQKRAPQLAAAVGAPRNGIQINADPSDASRGQYSVTLRDVLAVTTPWPGPSAPGETPFAPIPMGLYQTGAIATKIVGNKDGAKHELVQGTTGSGKSSGAKVEISELMTRRETAIMLVDVVKGIQTFGAAAPGLALMLTDEKKATAFIKRLHTHVLKERGAYLGAKGLAAWQPGCGLSWLHIQIEEAGNFLADSDIDDELKKLAKALRSVGVKLELSLQRPSHDEIDTTMRAQFGTVSCYGMGADDPVCLLPDEVLAAGADPSQWRDTMPGCNYLSGTGISVAAASTALRTYDLSDQVMAQHAAHYGPRMDALDPITAKALGPLWTNREEPAVMVDRIKRTALGAGPVPAATSDHPQHADNDQADDEDELLPAAAELVVTSQFGSTSMLQRKLRISFATAGRLMDDLQQHGIVGPPRESQAREVLVGPDEFAAALAAITGDSLPTSDNDSDDDGNDDHLTEEDMGVQTPDPDPDLTVTIDDPIDPLPDGVDLQFGAGEHTDLDTDTARAQVADRIAELEAAGHDALRVPDLADLVVQGGRSRAWYRKELLRLVKEGRLSDNGTGLFGIVPTDDPHDTDEQDADEQDGEAA